MEYAKIVREKVRARVTLSPGTCWPGERLDRACPEQKMYSALVMATAARFLLSSKVLQVETLAPMADSEQGRKDANLLKTYGQACIELSMVTEQLQDLVEAQRLVEVAVDALRSSTALAPDQEAFSMLAVATNAIGIRELDTGKARALFEEARVVFQSAIQLEKDVNAQRQMLLQLRELYSSYGTWREMHPEQAGEMPDEPVPYYLAALPSETDLLEQQQAEAKRVEEAAKGRRRGTKGDCAAKGRHGKRRGAQGHACSASCGGTGRGDTWGWCCGSAGRRHQCIGGEEEEKESEQSTQEQGRRGRRSGRALECSPCGYRNRGVFGSCGRGLLCGACSTAIVRGAAC